MKRFTITILMILLAATVFAEGRTEQPQEDMTIAVCGVGVSGWAESDFLATISERYPFVTFEYYEADIATGEDVTMIALMASGDAPDIYTDFIGRAGKYVTPKFALPLEIDESVWFADQIAPFKRGGKLYALPEAVPAQAMAVNLALIEEAGYELPDGLGWTISDFLDMARAVRDNTDEYATGLFAASPSADYLWVNWFASFGVDNLFADEYTRSVANDPKMLDAWRFFDTLMQEGFIHPNSAMWGAGDFLQAIGNGNMAAYGARMGWPTGMQKNYNKDGEHYEWVAKSFPSLDGEPVATAGGGHIIIGHKTENPLRAAIITDIMLAYTSREMQFEKTRLSGIPTRKDVPISTEMNPGEDIVVYLAQNFGLMDVGFPNRWYYETRSAGPTVLQPLLQGKITPEEAHQLYYEKITEIING